MIPVTPRTPHVNKEKGNAANAAFENQSYQWPELPFEFFLCLRLISPSIAVTMNCAVLSPGSFTWSIACTTSCGARACTFCDFALMLSVATITSHVIWWMPVYMKKNPKKVLWWMPVGDYSGCQLSVAALSYNKAPQDCSPNGASNHNVTETYIMACSHDTQTRPEFTYLFLGTPSDKPGATPVVLRAEANNEQQARSHFLNWNLVFAAQIRTKAPCRLQLMDGGDHFTWIFEQRFNACGSGVQEVANV